MKLSPEQISKCRALLAGSGLEGVYLMSDADVERYMEEMLRPIAVDGPTSDPTELRTFVDALRLIPLS